MTLSQDSIRVVAKNDGSAIASGTKYLRVSQGSRSYSITMPNLSPGEIYTLNITPADLGMDGGGTFTVTATVDSTNAITESDEGNNSRSGTININPPAGSGGSGSGPDLVVTSATRYVSGNYRYVYITVKNVGDQAVQSGWRLRVHANGQTFDYNYSFWGLQPGESKIRYINFGSDYSNPLNLTAGQQYDVTVELDSTDVVSEGDESNNEATVSNYTY